MISLLFKDNFMCFVHANAEPKGENPSKLINSESLQITDYYAHGVYVCVYSVHTQNDINRFQLWYWPRILKNVLIRCISNVCLIDQRLLLLWYSLLNTIFVCRHVEQVFNGSFDDLKLQNDAIFSLFSVLA